MADTWFLIPFKIKLVQQFLIASYEYKFLVHVNWKSFLHIKYIDKNRDTIYLKFSCLKSFAFQFRNLCLLIYYDMSVKRGMSSILFLFWQIPAIPLLDQIFPFHIFLKRYFCGKFFSTCYLLKHITSIYLRTRFPFIYYQSLLNLCHWECIQCVLIYIYDFIHV